MHDTPVIILANGGSSRFGSPKSQAMLNGRPLIDWVYERVSAQTSGSVLINAAAPLKTSFPASYVNDELERGLGPLAGIHAALRWAKGQGQARVATVSVDTPFLPLDLLTWLHDAGAPACAKSGGRKHPIIGLWDASACDQLEAYLKTGSFSAHGWLELCGARAVPFGPEEGIDPFFNINTPEDMQAAEDYLHAS